MWGGVLALIGAIVLGPRLGKYRKDGRSNAIPVTASPSLLWVCSSSGLAVFGFHPGSQLAASVEVNRVCHLALYSSHTNLAAVAGGLATMFHHLVIKIWQTTRSPLTLNASLPVWWGITAGCDLCVAFRALAIGAICGVLLPFGIEFIDQKLHIDDPVGASSVHGICGIAGTLLTGLFSVSTGALYAHGFGAFGAQVLGILCIDGWAVLCGVILFVGIKKTFGLRVDKRIEEEGLDIYEHGESCYN